MLLVLEGVGVALATVGEGDRPWGTADSSSSLAGWLTSSVGFMKSRLTSLSREWSYGG